MSQNFTAEEVRNQACWEMHSSGNDLTRSMLNAYADSIERAQSGVISNSTVAKARDAYNNALVGVSISQISAMRAALLAVWPSVPAQAAQMDFPECSGNPASCPENEGFGCCAEHAKPITLSTAEPLAQGETLRIGAPAWPGQMEGKAPPDGWVQLSVNSLLTQPHSPDTADSGRVGAAAMPADWAIAHIVRGMAASGMEGNSLTTCFQGNSLLRKAAALEATLAAQGQGEPDPMEAIVQHCMVTEAVSPDSADPYGTISRVIDWHQANTAPPAVVPAGYVLVPREPTLDMQAAHQIHGDTSDWWNAVIEAAAPSAPEGNVGAK